MLSILITLLLFILICKDYKTGVIVTAIFVQPLSYIGVGIGNIKLFYVFAFLSLLLLIIHYKHFFKSPYPKGIAIISIITSFCYLCTNYKSNHPNTILIISNILTSFIFPYILWQVIDNKKRLNETLKYLFVLIIISIIAVIPEIILRHNYSIDLIQKLFKTTDFIIDSSAIRFGIKRTNSIFSYFTTFGTFCYLTSFIIWTLLYKTPYKKKFLSIYLLILPFLAITTGSRAIFLGVFIILLSLFFNKDILKNKLFRSIIIISIILLPLVISYFSSILSSMTDPTSTELGGSSASVRLSQFEICYPYFMQSPIWGNGRMYIWDVVSPENPLLMGAESIWFSLMVDYGIIGCINFILLIIVCFFTLYKYNKRIAFMPIGYLLILTLSPDAGVQYNLLLTYIIIIIKIYKYLIYNNLYENNINH